MVRNVKNRGQMDASPEAMELLDLTNRVRGYECPHAVWQHNGMVTKPSTCQSFLKGISKYQKRHFTKGPSGENCGILVEAAVCRRVPPCTY